MTRNDTGEILGEEFVDPLGLNPHKLSLALCLSAPTVCEIVAEERAISTETALRLAHYFGTTPEFWLNLQTRYNLEVARDREVARIEQEVTPMARTIKRVGTRG